MDDRAIWAAGGAVLGAAAVLGLQALTAQPETPLPASAPIAAVATDAAQPAAAVPSATPSAAPIPATPVVTAKWLAGSWRSEKTRRPTDSCDTDGIVTFKANGTFRDGGYYGRFRTDGSSLTYYDRVAYDLADDSEDRSEFDIPQKVRLKAIDANTLSEDGNRLYRCDGGE